MRLSQLTHGQAALLQRLQYLAPCRVCQRRKYSIQRVVYRIIFILNHLA
jgi:hypothetical protein